MREGSRYKRCGLFRPIIPGGAEKDHFGRERQDGAVRADVDSIQHSFRR